MAKKSKSKARPFLAARCTPKQKKRITDAEKSTGLNETDFIHIALAEFFENHKTPAEQLAANQAYRLKQAQA